MKKVTMDEDIYSSCEMNYLRLIETIQELESNFRVTEDWTEDHKQHIFKYREMFPDFNKVNEDIESSDFRQKAYEAEIIITNLIHEIKFNGTINLKFYLILNKHLKYLCESVWSEDELADILGNMRM